MLSALVLMASNALLTPMTQEEIITKFAAVEQLKLTMAARSAGGRSASGRYKKHDTARKVYIDTVVMPSLRLGKRIEEEDWRLLFLPGDDDIQGADKVKMDAFYQKHKTDRRRSDNESYGLDSTRQQTLMTWVSRNLSGYALPQPAPSGSPPEYRLTMRDNKSYAGCTLSQLARETTSNRLRPDAPVPGGQTLLWIDSTSFAWRFPEHTSLFLSLRRLAEDGCRATGNAGLQAINAQHATARYQAYAQPHLQPRDDDADLLDSGGTATTATTTVDPILYQAADPSFSTINRITFEQQSYFRGEVAKMREHPYELWTDHWVRPADPTLVDFGGASGAAGWRLLPIYFFSPTRPNQWQRLGVCMPCARHGWDHASAVTVKNRWAIRLVKGVFSDWCLAGQECVCSMCRRERMSLDRQYQAAVSASANNVDVLKAKVDAASYGWMTYDPRVIGFYFEKMPWVALKLPAVVTHRGAVSVEVLQLLTRGASTGMPVHGVESTLAEFRSLRATNNALSFYSFQRTWVHRPQLFPEPAAPVVHLSEGISSVSDTYLTSILEDWYFGQEPYLLLWFEQHCPLDTVQSDHHCKYSSRLQHDGERMLSNVYKCMNSWGGIAISVFTETTSYGDATLVRAHDGMHRAAERHGHTPPYYGVLDNPYKDAKGWRENVYAGNGKARYAFPGRINIIVSEHECNAACDDLLLPLQHDANSTMIVGWDTETVAYTDGSGQNTATAALVQICRGDEVCHLFRVAHWTACFTSFARFMANPRVVKVAHYVSHDVADLQRRFPNLQIVGAVNLAPRIACLGLSSNALNKMIEQQFDRWHDCRVDHRLWACNRLLNTYASYAATDAWAVLKLDEAARQQPPSQPPPHARVVADSGDDSDEDIDAERSRCAAVSRRQGRAGQRIVDLVGGAIIDGDEVGDDDDDDDDDLRSTVDEPVGGDLATALLNTTKRQVCAYATGTDQNDLILSAALTSDQRKELHAFISQFDLQHMSVGNGTDRRLVVSRLTPFVAVTAAQAKDVIGALVLKDQGTQAPLRGMVMAYDESTTRWQLQYSSASTVPDETETVDLDTLNLRLRRRALADHGPDGLGGRGLPAAGGEQDSELLQELLDGINPDWATNLPKYDPRHWMFNFATIMGAEKGTPAFNLCMSLLSDALFWLLPGEEARQRAHCLALGMSAEQIARLKRKYWRRHCRYACPAPQQIIRACHDIFVFFSGMIDPLKPDGRHYMLVSNAKAIFMKEMKYIQEGLLSDPPGMNMYRVVGVHPRTAYPKFRTLRTSSPLEGHFLHYSRSVHPTAKSAGPRSMHVRSPRPPRPRLRNRCHRLAVPEVVASVPSDPMRLFCTTRNRAGRC